MSSKTSLRPWGTTRHDVSAWCRLPIAWNGRREGHRSKPRFDEGDAFEIVRTAGLLEDEEMYELAIELDSAISDVVSGRENGEPREDQQEYRDNRDNYLDEFYTALRTRLHPEQVARENAALDAALGL